MKEVGAVISITGEVLHWHEPEGSTGGSLPDSNALWQIIWAAHQENKFWGFAHTHPGHGTPAPSSTDITTFRAIERALGRAVSWWIASADDLIIVRSDLDKKFGLAHGDGYTWMRAIDTHWLRELRRRSQYY